MTSLPVPQDLNEQDFDEEPLGVLSLSLPVVNPISRIRDSENQSLRQFARRVPCNYQLLYLTEKGCYQQVPRAIETYCRTVLDVDTILLPVKYEEFQRCRRQASGTYFGWLNDWVEEVTVNSILGEGGWQDFREYLGLSKMGFCKAFCVPPIVLNKVENSQVKQLPYAIENALFQAGLPTELIGELSERL